MTQDRLIKVRALAPRHQLVLLTFSLGFAPFTQSANYVRTELPVRISHRLRDMQALPYVVVTKEGVARVYDVRAFHCPIRALAQTRLLVARTFFSFIGQLSKSEE